MHSRCTSPILPPTSIRDGTANETQVSEPSAVKESIAAPVLRSQTRSVLSKEAETARFPSGVTATALTASAWPSSVRRLAPVLRSQTRIYSRQLTGLPARSCRCARFAARLQDRHGA
jgi:hypothetical protein